MNKNKSTVTITSEGITTTVISKEGISIINEDLGEISFKLSNKKTAQETTVQEQYIDFSDLPKGYLLLDSVSPNSFTN